MGLVDIAEREGTNRRVADAVRLAADKLNDAIIECARAGVSVQVEVVEVGDSSDKVIRNVVQVTPLIILRY